MLTEVFSFLLGGLRSDDASPLSCTYMLLQASCSFLQLALLVFPSNPGFSSAVRHEFIRLFLLHTCRVIACPAGFCFPYVYAVDTVIKLGSSAVIA